MKIIPLIGFDKIVLGSTKEEISELIGKPSSIEQETWPDKTLSDTWLYPNMEIELSFDSDNDYRLTTITIYSQKANLEGMEPIGLKENELIKKLPSVQLEEDFEENGKSYIYPQKELSFWVVDGVVENLTLFPEYDKTGNTPIWPK